jgi:hypothetical protein
MTNWKCTEDKFLVDVKAHQMTILRDDGVYRHLRFAKPRTNNQRFDLVTTEGDGI